LFENECPTYDDMVELWYEQDEHGTYTDMLEEYAAEMYGTLPVIRPMRKAYELACNMRAAFRGTETWDFQQCWNSRYYSIRDVAWALMVPWTHTLQDVCLTGIKHGSLDDFLQLGDGLARCSQLRSLSLRELRAGGNCLAALLKGLGTPATLRNLDLSAMALYSGTTVPDNSGMEALAAWMANPAVAVDTLDLSDNALHLSGACFLGLLLRHNTSLRTLRMDRCSLGINYARTQKEDYRPLFDGLAANRTLEALSCDSDGQPHNRIAIYFLVDAIRDHPQLTDLRIPQQLYLEADVFALSKLIGSPTCRLKKLDISHAYLRTDDEWIAVGSAIAANKSLRNLWMRNAKTGIIEADKAHHRLFGHLVVPNVTLHSFVDDCTFHYSAELEGWEQRNHSYHLRARVCRDAALAMMGMGKFRRSPLLRGYRDVFLMLARALMATKHRDEWSKLSGEAHSKPPVRKLQVPVHYYLSAREGPARINAIY